MNFLWYDRKTGCSPIIFSLPTCVCLCMLRRCIFAVVQCLKCLLKGQFRIASFLSFCLSRTFLPLLWCNGTWQQKRHANVFVLISVIISSWVKNKLLDLVYMTDFRWLGNVLWARIRQVLTFFALRLLRFNCSNQAN